MTVMRVNPDRDYAAIVTRDFNRARYLKVHIKQKGESISGIAKSYYGGFELWPMIWLDNDAIANPNVVPDGFPLLIRRPDRVTMSDRVECRKLFNAWQTFPSLRQTMAEQHRREVEQRRQILQQPGDTQEWERWNNARP